MDERTYSLPAAMQVCSNRRCLCCASARRRPACCLLRLSSARRLLEHAAHDCIVVLFVGGECAILEAMAQLHMRSPVARHVRRITPVVESAVSAAQRTRNMQADAPRHGGAHRAHRRPAVGLVLGSHVLHQRVAVKVARRCRARGAQRAVECRTVGPRSALRRSRERLQQRRSVREGRRVLASRHDVWGAHLCCGAGAGDDAAALQRRLGRSRSGGDVRALGGVRARLRKLDMHAARAHDRRGVQPRGLALGDGQRRQRHAAHRARRRTGRPAQPSVRAELGTSSLTQSKQRSRRTA